MDYFWIQLSSEGGPIVPRLLGQAEGACWDFPHSNLVVETAAKVM